MRQSGPKPVRFVIFLLLVTMLPRFGGSVYAAVPYGSYIYNFWKEKTPAPQAYIPTAVIDGALLGVGDLRSPLDVFVDRDDLVYLLDTGNNRIICMDTDWKVVRVIDGFENNGRADRFRNPGGLFVTGDKHIYVADTDNGRIIELDPTGALVRTIGKPEAKVDGIIPENFIYQPVKVGVDPAGRIYVVSNGVFEGLITFDPDGSFQGFIGAPKVTPSMADLFWTKIASREQRKRKALFLPINFSSLDMDAKGFIYATVNTVVNKDGLAENKDEKDQLDESSIFKRAEIKTRDDIIKRLSPSGVDVLRREGFTPPKGHSHSGAASTFRDIASRSFKGYSALDENENSRMVFTYDENGNLLYVFGGKGPQIGNFLEPVAIDALTDQRMLVLDKGRNALTVFSPTEYAQTIHAAIQYHQMGLYDRSTDMWRKTLALNMNYDLAYRGMARAMLMAHRYEEAMDYALLGHDRQGYSKAFKNYRKIVIERHFGKAFPVFILLLMGIWLYRRRRGGRQNRSYTDPEAGTPLARLRDSLRYSLHVIFHPFDGFWDLKHEKRGNVAAATIILLFVCVSYVFLRQYTGFLFNYRNLAKLNIYRESASILVPFGLWSIVNWAMTTLMDGKGTLRDIYIASAYALTPMALIMIPATILSRFLIIEEGALYSALVAFSLGWSLILAFFGAMVIHDYDVKKNAIASACTLGGMGLMIFVILLFSSIIAQLIGFVMDVYYEIVFRL